MLLKSLIEQVVDIAYDYGFKVHTYVYPRLGLRLTLGAVIVTALSLDGEFFGVNHELATWPMHLTVILDTKATIELIQSIGEER